MTKPTHGIAAYRPTGDTVMRLHAQTAAIENGLVHLPRDAPWLEGYVHELLTFPNGRHDDQVDSTAQALDWFRQRASEPALLAYLPRAGGSAGPT